MSQWCQSFVGCCLLALSCGLWASEPLQLWAKAHGDKRVLYLGIMDTTQHHITWAGRNRLVIELRNTPQGYASQELKHVTDQSWVRSVKYQPSHTSLRLELWLGEPLRLHNSRVQHTSHQKELRIELRADPQNTPSSQNMRALPDTTQRPFIIAVDPGHGGSDPGAIGPTGVREKEVTLGIAQRLAKILNSLPQRRAVLTRESDRYVSLKERVDWARSMGADLLISIHADGYIDPKVDGASVFVLSQRGASSEAARWASERENEVALLGGVDLEEHDPSTTAWLLELSHAASRSASHELGVRVLEQLGQVTKIHKKQVESAAFRVLKAPDIPSVLVETGFISNPSTEQKLKSPQHQELLAQALSQAVEAYLKGQDLPGVQPQNLWSVRKEYVVQSGDSLAKIAQRFQIPLAELRRVNQAEGSLIYPNQVLKLP